MNTDAINQLACNSSKHIVKYRALCDLNEEYSEWLQDGNNGVLSITKDGLTGKYKCSAINDNKRNSVFTQRVGTVVEYLNSSIFTTMTESHNLVGYYPISSHDISNKEGALTFSNSSDSRSVLLPDMYQILGYYGRTTQARNDKYSWDNKIPKMFFLGASTGSFNPSNNDRIQAALWSLNHRNISDFGLSQLVQIPVPTLEQYLGDRLTQIKRSNIDIQKQLLHKYMVSIDGNTAAWDRPVWIMQSNSLLLKYRSNDMCWYYPLMQAGNQFVHVESLNELPTLWQRLESSHNDCLRMIHEATKFSSTYCTDKAAHIRYTRSLFENY